MTAHCATCTCSRQDAYCDSKATLGHETWECLEKLCADGTHFLPHRGQAVWDDPCYICEGYEQHADFCSSAATVNQSKPLVEVQWGETGDVRMMPFDVAAFADRLAGR